VYTALKQFEQLYQPSHPLHLPNQSIILHFSSNPGRLIKSKHRFNMHQKTTCTCVKKLLTVNVTFRLGAGYTSDFVCDFMSNLLQIADAIWCICDLVSHTEMLPLHVACNMVLRYGVAICCANRHGHGIAHQTADTQNRICDLVQKKR
jgi:hypothetical protein